MARQARRVRLAGRVQGIGFRPWAVRAARARGLTGGVRNVASGVHVELEGDGTAIEDWLAALRVEFGDALEAVEATPAAVLHRTVFRIEPSDAGADSAAAQPGASEAAAAGQGGLPRIPPDLPVCPACVAELFDPRARRHRYPFTHCACCGPRASVLLGLPYDRERTTLCAFAPCTCCQREYADPGDRRFHAQTLACPDCGPRMAAYDPTSARATCTGESALEAAVQVVRGGGIAAIKGYGGYHLICDATSSAAVQRLRRRKGRPRKPFAVLVPDLAQARRWVDLDPEAEAWLAGPARAVVLAPRLSQRGRCEVAVPMRTGDARPADAPAFAAAPARTAIASEVAPGVLDLGLILPWSPLHWLLLYAPGATPMSAAPRFHALVFTSANRSEEPTLHANEEARAQLAAIADLVLEHDRPVARPSDDPVVRATGAGVVPIRLSRGTSPLVFPLPERLRRAPPLIALGGDLKCAPALLAHGEVLLSEHIGDLGAVAAVDALEARTTSLCRLAGVKPEAIACDLHPGYIGHALARRSGLQPILVQHHHAHARACLAESGAALPALALVLDGAGWGPDASIWGGELLLVTLDGVERLAHLERVRWPGGDAAVREPWRCAAVWLQRAFPGGAPPLDWHTRRDRELCARLLAAAERGIHSPLSSSCGRLFDAVASILDLCDHAGYEAEPALALETLASSVPAPPSPLPAPSARAWRPTLERGAPFEIPVADLIRDVTLAHARGAPRASIARAFHEHLAARLVQTATVAARATRLHRIALTGGCLQNRLLAGLLTTGLRAHHLDPLTHHRIPPSDANLALGQALVAAEALSPSMAEAALRP